MLYTGTWKNAAYNGECRPSISNTCSPNKDSQKPTSPRATAVSSESALRGRSRAQAAHAPTTARANPNTPKAQPASGEATSLLAYGTPNAPPSTQGPASPAR